jgi:ligand-binding sensor domain-containing protein
MPKPHRPLLERLGLAALFFLLACAVSPRVGLAQYNFDHWTADNGLPQNTVNDIRQTRDGYLWLTTYDGLVRFDGVHFTIFNKSNSPALSSNRFIQLHENVRGDLWASTEEGGVVRYHEGQFESYGPEHWLQYSIAVMYDDANGNLLACLNNNEVRRWEDGNFVPQTQAQPLQTSPGEPGTRIENRRVLCSQNSYSIGCYPNEPITIRIGPGGPLSSNPIRRGAVEDHRGVLWLVSAEVGLIKVEHGQVTRIYTVRDGLPGRPLLLVSGLRPGVLTRDDQGTVWLTGIETWQHQLISKPSSAPVIDWSNAFAYEDREGNLWFGSDREGLFRASSLLRPTPKLRG